MSSTQIDSPAAPVSQERPPFPLGVPVKFSVDGVLQRFPGNTTVCHIPDNSPLLPVLHITRETLKAHPILSKYLHFLPSTSWHMTVFEGVCDKERKPGFWPVGKENQPLDECTQAFASKLRQLGLDLGKEGLSPPYRMRVRGFDPALVGIALEVEGETPEEDARMRRLRDTIGDRLGFRMPDHDSYIFHVSIAYLLRHVDGQDRNELNKVFEMLLPKVKQQFQLGPVEFNVFEDMYSYPRLFYLGE